MKTPNQDPALAGIGDSKPVSPWKKDQVEKYLGFCRNNDFQHFAIFFIKPEDQETVIPRLRKMPGDFGEVGTYEDKRIVRDVIERKFLGKPEEILVRKVALGSDGHPENVHDHTFLATVEYIERRYIETKIQVIVFATSRKTKKNVESILGMKRGQMKWGLRTDLIQILELEADKLSEAEALQEVEDPIEDPEANAKRWFHFLQWTSPIGFFIKLAKRIKGGGKHA